MKNIILLLIALIGSHSCSKAQNDAPETLEIIPNADEPRLFSITDSRYDGYSIVCEADTVHLVHMGDQFIALSGDRRITYDVFEDTDTSVVLSGGGYFITIPKILPVASGWYASEWHYTGLAAPRYQPVWANLRFAEGNDRFIYLYYPDEHNHLGYPNLYSTWHKVDSIRIERWPDWYPEYILVGNGDDFLIIYQNRWQDDQLTDQSILSLYRHGDTVLSILARGVTDSNCPPHDHVAIAYLVAKKEKGMLLLGASTILENFLEQQNK